MKKLLIYFIVGVITWSGGSLSLAQDCGDSNENGQYFEADPSFFSSSEYLETEQVGFDIKPRGKSGDIVYTLGLSVIKPLPLGALIEVEFENPEDAKHPVFVEYEPQLNQEWIQLVSPPVKGFVANREYMLLVRVYADKKRTKLIGLHQQISAINPYNYDEMLVQGLEYLKK